MADQKLIYVTFNGIPLYFTLEWPFHQSAGGADYFVLHGNAELGDGSGLHALLSVHLSQTVKEALTSLEPKDALGPSINTVRKAADTRDIEFIKSSKRQPFSLSSRAFSIVSRKFTFQNASDDQIEDFLRTKAYWLAKLGQPKFQVTDPVEQQYLGTDAAHLVAAAEKLAQNGSITLNGEEASATDNLMKRGSEIEGKTRKTLEDLEAKHAYERG